MEALTESNTLLSTFGYYLLNVYTSQLTQVGADAADAVDAVEWYRQTTKLCTMANRLGGNKNGGERHRLFVTYLCAHYIYIMR